MRYYSSHRTDSLIETIDNTADTVCENKVLTWVFKPVSYTQIGKRTRLVLKGFGLGLGDWWDGY